MLMKSKLVTILIIMSITGSLVLIGFAFAPAEVREPLLTKAKAPDIGFPFNDIRGHWAESAIIEMYAKGVMIGYKDSTFRPKKPVTFLEAVVMVDKLLYGKPSIIDTSPSSNYLHDQYNIPEWAVGYISSAMRHEILPWEKLQKVSQQPLLTREQAAELAVRALELTKQVKQKSGATVQFTDAAQITENARGFVALACERRVMNGFPDGSFQPAGPISRAEIAILLANIADQLPYINSEETSGFIKSVDVEHSTVKFVYEEGTEAEITLPGLCLIYLDDKTAGIDQLAQGNHLRVIQSHSGDLTVVIAQAVVPDLGVPLASEKVNLALAPEIIRQWVETNKSSETYMVMAANGSLYFLVTRGEKMTAGYNVNIIKVSSTADEKGADFRIWVDRTDPSPDTFVNQVISYPFALVRVDLPQKTIDAVTFVDKLNQVISEAKI